MDALTAAVAANPLTDIWLPLFAGVGALAAVIFAALRFRPEGDSRLYGDAMKMVAELQSQRASDRAEIAHLERSLQESVSERQALEQQVIRLYSRIEALEAKLGGRRSED